MDARERLRTGIIRGVTAIVVIATATSMTMSYAGLHDWAAEHGYSWFTSWIFPAFVDAFPLAAEGVLILAYLDDWPRRARIMPWVVLTLGLVVSVGLNVAHVFSPHSDPYTLGGNGFPPVATWLALLVGTMAFKRTLANAPRPAEAEPDEMEYVLMPADELELQAAAEAFADDIAAGRTPGLNRIRKVMRCGHRRAPILQAHLARLATQNHV